MSNKALISALIIIGASTAPVQAFAEMPKDNCKGQACEDVSIVWTDKGYAVSNDGIALVKVGIQAWTGSSCGESKTVELEPGQIANYGFAAFCSPIRASYLLG